MPKAKLTKRFSVTLPQEIRKKLHLQPGDTLIFMLENNKAYFFNAGKERKTPPNYNPEKSSQYVLELRQRWKEQEKQWGLQK